MDDKEENNLNTAEKNEETAKKERLKAEIEKQKKLKAIREAEVYKRKYFELYDDVKISYKEDW